MRIGESGSTKSCMAEADASEGWGEALEAGKQTSQQPAVNKAQSQASGQGDGPAAELRVLKAMQEELNRRTEAAGALSGTGGALDKARQGEAAELARQQGRLADLTQDLLQRLSRQAERERNQP